MEDNVRYGGAQVARDAAQLGASPVPPWAQVRPASPIEGAIDRLQLANVRLDQVNRQLADIGDRLGLPYQPESGAKPMSNDAEPNGLLGQLTTQHQVLLQRIESLENFAKRFEQL